VLLLRTSDLPAAREAVDSAPLINNRITSFEPTRRSFPAEAMLDLRRTVAGTAWQIYQ